MTQNSGTNGTVAFFRNPNLGATSQSCIMVGGNTIASDRTARFGFVDATNLADRAVSIGYHNRDMLTIRTTGLSINNLARFDYDEGTWTPTISIVGSLSVTYTAQEGWWRRIGKKVTVGFKLLYSYSYGVGVDYFFVQGLPTGLRQVLQEEVSQITIRGSFSGITNPYYVTLWRDGYNLPGVATFNGLTFTVGAYDGFGGYVTGAFQNGGTISNQQVWTTMTYLLP